MQKCANLVELEKCLKASKSNEYLVEKLGFDTAAKSPPKFANFSNISKKTFCLPAPARVNRVIAPTPGPRGKKRNPGYRVVPS